MCQSKSGCSHPDNLKGKPKDCSAEQITTCHPGEKGHPCEIEEGEKEHQRGVEVLLTSTPLFGHVIETEIQILL